MEAEAEVNASLYDGRTALILASQEGHCDVVRLLLEGEAEINTVANDGSTALMLASQNGRYDVVRLLLEREADVNAVEEHGYTALILASQDGHCDVVRLLLEQKAEVNTATQAGSTALTYAIHYGHCDVVRLLLEREVDVNASIQDGGNALMLASQNGHYNLVRLLLDKEAEVNTVEEDGYTALILASQDGHCDVVRLLLDRKADVNASIRDGRTALILASQNGHYDVVRLLLQCGAELHTDTQNGWTALMLGSQNGHYDVVRLLLEREAEVNTIEQDGWTALILASQDGHCDVVRLLLEQKAEVNTATQAGSTALTYASQGGHCDVVRLLLEAEADVNASLYDGKTALILASQEGCCDVVGLLLEGEAEINTVTHDGSTALILASRNGHCDVVRLLMEKEAEINTVTQDGRTALIVASEKGHWNIAKLLINAGANVSHVSKYGESAAMYIIFAETAKKCDTHLGESMKHIWQNPLSPKSHYGMSCASSALVGAFLYDAQSEWFDCHFAKLALQEDVMYAFLPNIFYQYGKSYGQLFSPYQGIEGRICLHTMGTAVVCKLPHMALQWLTSHHRDNLINMLAQTPMHLLAMEHLIVDMQEKILLLTERVSFSFSDRDGNGRVPYHIACLCFNAKFLFCGLRLDSNFRTNMLIEDHLGKTPLAYMTYLLNSTTGYSGVQGLKFLCGRKLIQNISSNLAPSTQSNACTNPRMCNTTVDSLRKHFKANMTVAELSQMIKKADNIFFGNYDITALCKCNAKGIVLLSDKQHIIISVIHLLHLIGTEMGRIDPLFECVPELKGSVQEYTKCGKLDEVDMSMKLVNFTDYFSIYINGDNINIYAEIVPECNRYWISGDRGMFSSIEFCADFWEILLKALHAEVTQAYIKSNGLIIENFKRKHGFVGMPNISCQIGGRFQLISVDIAPCIVSHSLKGYTALLRPRHYDNKEVGDEYYQGLELSSSERDWDFLKFLPPEVMCAYALVKMLRSLADTFQTEEGRVYTAEDILPSYMVKTALLWILDPDEKYANIYAYLDINLAFNSEYSSSYNNDVLVLCQDILHDSHAYDLDSRDLALLVDVCEKCTKKTGHLTMREKILPYVLASRCSDKKEQNGINLQWMQENWKPDIKDISHQDETIYSRKFYTGLESERIKVEHKSDKKPVRQMSHYKIAYPDISEKTARKCRVWALRILRVLPLLLQYNGWTTDGEVNIIGVRNYYLPEQEIHASDKDLAVALCRILETVLE